MIKEKVDIILPVYFEQDNIEQVIKNIKKNVKTPHLITTVIQDKKDPTINVIHRLQKTIKNIRIIYTKNGKGMLKALKAGINNTHAPIIVVTMADLSDDAKDIDKMIAKIKQGYDLVCASRYSKKGQRIGGPKIKGFLSFVACKSLALLTRIPTNDATNAFKCFRRTLIESIPLESKEGFEMPLELTVKAFYHGYKIAEIPTIWKDRITGKSKFILLSNLRLYLRWYFFALTHQVAIAKE